MTTYLTKKRKLNVPLFIVLLIFAFVPGILYFIWTKFPAKVSADPKKGYGWLGRVIGAGVAVLTWFYWSCVTGFSMTFMYALVPSLVLFAVAFFTKKAENKLMLWVTILATLANLIIMFAFGFWFYGATAFIAYIVIFVACAKGITHYNYHVLGKKEGWEGAEEAPVAEEVKVEE